MGRIHSVVLIDGDLQRRAAVCRELMVCGHRVEPLEDISDLMIFWPSSGLIIVHDEGETIARLITQMGGTGRWLPVIAFAEDPAPGRIARAVLNGAIDYIAWPFGEAELNEAMENVERRAQRLGSARLRESMARSRVELLTRREREVLTAVACGMSNRRIGEKLGISPRTVEIHRASMLTKMGASHTSEAIRLAIEASLLG